MAFVWRLVFEQASGDSKSVFLQSDHANLALLHTELEAALAESKSVHTQRVLRYVR